MKKIFTLLACICLSGIAAMAMPNLPKGVTDGAKITISPEQKAKLRAACAAAQMDAIQNPNSENNYTRTWTDPRTGEVWTLQNLKMQETLPEMLAFTDENGNEVHYTFEEMPYYLVQYILWKADTNGNIVSQISFIMGWPSKYLWSQIFDYDGPLTADGYIPDDKIEWEAVTPDELMNSSKHCRYFKETEQVGGSYNDTKTDWAFFTLLPNQALDMVSIVDGAYGYTTISGSSSSNITYVAYQEDGNVIDVKNNIYWTSEAGSRKSIRHEYIGGARVEGFSSRHMDLPEWGDVHIFNCGLASRELAGETDLYPDEWPELTKFYFCAGDKYVEWFLDPACKIFDPSAISLGIMDLPAGENLDMHANIFRGYGYANAKYGKTPSETNVPNELQFNLMMPEVKFDEAMGEDYLAMAPQANCLIPGGYDQEWSEIEGVSGRINNFADYFDEPTALVLGTTQGFIFDATDIYTNTLYAESTGDIIYHWDPTDAQKTVKYSSIGTLEYSAVETIDAEVANGEAVYYNLQGVKVANPEKGIFVKVQNGKATKIAK